jgi:hypothetical protein
MYGFQSDAGSAIGLSKPESDSSFQIYSPPYLSIPAPGGGVIPQPTIANAPSTVSWNGTLHIESPDASTIGKVVLVRNPSMTHLTDADQRNVELKITADNGDELSAAVPGSTVLPPGPYMLFIERAVNVGGVTRYVPSVSRPVRIG